MFQYFTSSCYTGYGDDDKVGYTYSESTKKLKFSQNCFDNYNNNKNNTVDNLYNAPFINNEHFSQNCFDNINNNKNNTVDNLYNAPFY